MAKNDNIKTFCDQEKCLTVDYSLCKSCGLCREVCPVGCIPWSKDKNGIYGAPRCRAVQMV
jgi:Pyruvate/2-oxoacid:ferredoxin oxidoreductase delta subunit